MAMLFTTLLFIGVALIAAQAIVHELTRPLSCGPACADDMLFDQLSAMRLSSAMTPRARRAAAVTGAMSTPLRVSAQPVPLRARLTLA